MPNQSENAAETGPLDLILFCPACWGQHVDEADPSIGWDNPPHRSHLCHYCGAVWRPSDSPTNGVAKISTKGTRDNWTPCATRADSGDRYAQGHGEALLKLRTAIQLLLYTVRTVMQNEPDEATIPVQLRAGDIRQAREAMRVTAWETYEALPAPASPSTVPTEACKGCGYLVAVGEPCGRCGQPPTAQGDTVPAWRRGMKDGTRFTIEDMGDCLK